MTKELKDLLKLCNQEVRLWAEETLTRAIAINNIENIMTNFKKQQERIKLDESLKTNNE